MNPDLAFRITDTWRALFVPVGVLGAGIITLIGVILTLRNARTIAREERLWNKRVDVYTQMIVAIRKARTDLMFLEIKRHLVLNDPNTVATLETTFKEVQTISDIHNQIVPLADWPLKGQAQQYLNLCIQITEGKGGGPTPINQATEELELAIRKELGTD